MCLHARRPGLELEILEPFDLGSLTKSGAVSSDFSYASLLQTSDLPASGTSLFESLRLIRDPELEGVTGVYFNGTREARADAQAYDAEARRRLRELSERLTGL